MSGMEIERKFLVRGDDYKRRAHKSYRIKQGYIYTAPGSASAYYAVCQSLTDLRGTFMLFNPLNDRTDGLVGYAQLRAMKPSAYIVNMGRGGIVVEADLVRALDEGIIAGAATDVFTKEPPPADHPYLHVRHPERLLLTPHIGWASRQARECLVRKIAGNIKDTFEIH
mgnify:CR=1 FL=1